MPEQTLGDAALELEAHIVRRLQAVADSLIREDIPPTIVGHTMLRLGLQAILAAEGPNQMHASASEYLHMLTPKPRLDSKRKKRP